MKNAMLSAIKSKRSMPDMSDDAQHEEGGKDLHSIVASLSPNDREKLKGILDAGHDQASKIQKGEASTEEQGHIEQKMAEENEHNAAEAQDDELKHADHDSDEVQMSMLDRKDIQAAGSDMKPRNLGERARMQAANNLKAKGKI